MFDIILEFQGTDHISFRTNRCHQIFQHKTLHYNNPEMQEI